MKFVAIDIETSGLYPFMPFTWNGVEYRSKIFCIAVNDGKNIQVYEDPRKVAHILEDPTIKKVIHNAAFDSFWLRRMYGIRVRNIWDTRVMEQVIIGDLLPKNAAKNEELKKELSTSLLYTLSRYGLADLKNKEMGASFAGRDFNKPLTAAEVEYVKNDVRYLLHLQAMQERRLIGLDLLRVANLENSLVETVVEMRNRGLGCDTNVWLSIARESERAYNAILKKLPANVENWNSPAQVKKYFQSRGIPMNSFEEIDDLQEVYNDPVLAKFIELRALYKDVTTYGAKWLEDDIKIRTVDPDGRIRADYEQIGGNTGRFSCSHPNLQQNRDKHKLAFVPRKGHVFIAADYSSQEIGIAAAASKEERWIKAILRGEDIHSLTASIVFAEDWKNGYSKGCKFPFKCDCPGHYQPRQNAKITNFTILYGGGPKNISEKSKMSMRDATKTVYKFKKSAPQLTRFLSKNAEAAIDTRISYSADPFRRRRTLRDPEDWMLSNIGKNNPIQSCGANMLKLAMVSLDEELCPLVHTEHDALVIEVKKSQAKKAAKALKIVMEKAADYCTGVPGLIKAEPVIMENLKKKK